MNDPTAYSKFYENILQENAEELYEEANLTATREKELKQYLEIVNATDESASAEILETLIATDLDLVVLILRNINAELGGAILGEMTAENGATVLKRMAPEQ